MNGSLFNVIQRFQVEYLILIREQIGPWSLLLFKTEKSLKMIKEIKFHPVVAKELQPDESV